MHAEAGRTDTALCAAAAVLVLLPPSHCGTQFGIEEHVASGNLKERNLRQALHAPSAGKAKYLILALVSTHAVAGPRAELETRPALLLMDGVYSQHLLVQLCAGPHGMLITVAFTDYTRTLAGSAADRLGVAVKLRG